MPERVDALDSVRGICALAVAVHHFKANGLIAQLPIFKNAFLFVDLFFVLSGFVISMSYFANLDRRIGMRDFAIKRFARLYPLHIFVIAIFLLMELVLASALSNRPPFTGPMSFEGLVVNVLMLNSIGLTDGLTWNYPSWSIGAELMTYLVFAGIVWAFGRRSLVLFAVLVPAGLLLLAIASPDYIDATHDFGFVRCLVGFSTGVLTWRVVSSATVCRLVGTYPRGAFTGAEVALCAGVLGFVWFAGHSGANLLSPILFAFFVGGFFFQRGAVSHFLATPILVWLGALSYSIYMVHALIASRLFSGGLEVMERIISLNLISDDGLFGATPIAGDMMVFLYLGIVILAAWVTYHYIEMPGQRLLRRLLGASDTKVLLDQRAGGSDT